MDNVKNDIESTKESAHSSVEDIRDQTEIIHSRGQSNKIAFKR